MPWTFVQGGSQQYLTVSTPQTLTFGSNVTLGDLLIVNVAVGNNSTTPSVSDSQGNSYTRAYTSASAGLALYEFFAIAGSTGANTVTMNPNTTTSMTGAIHEYSGNASSSPEDSAITNQSSPSVSTFSSGTVSVSGTGDMIHAAFAQNTANDSATAGSGFNLRENQNTGNLGVAIYTEDGFPFSSNTAAALTVSPTAVPYVGGAVSYFASGIVDNLPWLPQRYIFEEEFEYRPR